MQFLQPGTNSLFIKCLYIHFIGINLICSKCFSGLDFWLFLGLVYLFSYNQTTADDYTHIVHAWWWWSKVYLYTAYQCVSETISKRWSSNYLLTQVTSGITVHKVICFVIYIHFRVLRHICGCLQRTVAKRWPDNAIVKPRVVSGFIFLRLLCPAIVNPRNFNLVTEPPADSAIRTLKLLAKSLINLANLVEVGTKEPYMEAVGPFIVDNKPKMMSFLNDLAVSYSHCYHPTMKYLKYMKYFFQNFVTHLVLHVFHLHSGEILWPGNMYQRLTHHTILYRKKIFIGIEIIPFCWWQIW